MYGRSSSRSPQDQVRDFFVRSGIPATWTIIAISIVSFFTFAIVPGGGPFPYLAFDSLTWPTRFWTMLTWPLVGAGLSTLFGALWAWWVAGSLERSWGTRTFLTFLVATSALTAITLWLGSCLLHQPTGLTGLWEAMAAPTIAWCVLNRREVIRFYGIIPVPAPLLGALTMVILWFSVGPPFLGLFALSGCAAAYWYAQHGRFASRGGLFDGHSGGRGTPARTVTSPSGTTLRFRDFDREADSPRRPFSLSRWLRDRKQRRELEKLWKRSGFNDPNDKK